jgi:hypothetical protein
VRDILTSYIKGRTKIEGVSAKRVENFKIIMVVGVSAWMGFKCLRKISVAESCKYSNELLGSIKAGNFLIRTSRRSLLRGDN